MPDWTVTLDKVRSEQRTDQEAVRKNHDFMIGQVRTIAEEVRGLASQVAEIPTIVTQLATLKTQPQAAPTSAIAPPVPQPPFPMMPPPPPFYGMPTMPTPPYQGYIQGRLKVAMERDLEVEETHSSRKGDRNEEEDAASEHETGVMEGALQWIMKDLQDVSGVESRTTGETDATGSEYALIAKETTPRRSVGQRSRRRRMGAHFQDPPD
jgi:hypothetical protein